MALNVPDVGSQIVDRQGRTSGPLNAFFNLLKRALLLEGPFSQGDVIIFQGGNNGVAGGDVAEFVKKTGTLNNHEVILGSGTNIVHALGSTGTAGQVLTSLGVGFDPAWGGAISGLSFTTTVMTNAQIKAMPTTPTTLVPAPGSGLKLVPIIVDVHGDFTAGAYSNINADSWMNINIGSFLWSNFLGNDSVLGIGYVTLMFGVAQLVSWQFVPETSVEPINYWNNLIDPYTGVATQHENQPLVTFFQNSGSGDLADGHINNTLTLNALCATVTI